MCLKLVSLRNKQMYLAEPFYLSKIALVCISHYEMDFVQDHDGKKLKRDSQGKLMKKKGRKRRMKKLQASGEPAKKMVKQQGVKRKLDEVTEDSFKEQNREEEEPGEEISITVVDLEVLKDFYDVC